MSEKNEKTKIKYRWLSSVYDLTVGSFLFSRTRQREFELMQIQPNQRILLVGDWDWVGYSIYSLVCRGCWD